MKFLITGGAGFIGAHLAEDLLQTGEPVTVVDDLSTGSLQNLESLLPHPNFRFLQKNVCAITEWSQLLDANTHIIHLAATVGVNRVMQDPAETLENNFNSTILLLKLAKEYRCRLFFASTSEVYGNLQGNAFSETDALIVPNTHCGRSAYVLGKIISENYCMHYHRQFGVPVIIARFFNVIGQRQVDRFGMVVPTFIRQALSGSPITIYGDGSQTRSFCAIQDVTQAIRLLLGTETAAGEVFNIGTSESVCMAALARHIKQITASSSPLIFVPLPESRSEGRDISHRSACIDKIKAFTGWEPATHWQTAVNDILRHHQTQHQTAQALVL